MACTPNPKSVRPEATKARTSPHSDDLEATALALLLDIGQMSLGKLSKRAVR